MRGLRSKLFGSRRRTIIVLLVVLALIAASAAYAGWQVTRASGNGSGKAGQLVAPTVSNAAAPTGDLFPTGNLDGALQVEINNPNTGTLYIRSVGPLNMTNVVGGTPQCDWGTVAFRNAHLLVKGQVTNGLSVAVAPGTSQVSIPNLVGLGTGTPTDCQGTTINGIGIVNVLFDTTP